MLRRAFLRLAAVAILHPALRWMNGHQDMAWRDVWYEQPPTVYMGTYQGIPMWGRERLHG